jgi:arginyl-tRNA synthetase
VPVAFQLARTLRKAPKAIAQELMAALGDIPGVARVAAAPNGYLNVFLDRRTFLLPRVRQEVALEAAAPEKTIVEHTAINPNKAAHIGHLRNAALGDTIARVLRFRGTPVEVQNYIDDLGVQVADIIVGFRDLQQRKPRRRSYGSPTRRGSTISAGTCTRASLNGMTRTQRTSRDATRRCTTSRPAATRRPPWARSSSSGSCARTSRRWRG